MSDDRDDEILDLTEEMTAESDSDADSEDEGPAEAQSEGGSEAEAAGDDEGGPDPDSDSDLDPDSEGEDPAEASGEGGPRQSGPPPKSPFTLLKEPRTEEEIRDSRVSVVPPEERKGESRPSFVPKETDTAVVTAQVVRLGEGGPAVAEEFRKAEAEAAAAGEGPAEAEGEGGPGPGPEAEPEEVETEEPEAEEEKPEEAEGGDSAESASAEATAGSSTSSEDEGEAAEDGEDDEILDLGQEFVVADEVTDDDVGSEPIPLVTESMPPPEPTEDGGGDSTESASAEAAAGSSTSSDAEAAAGSSTSSEDQDTARDSGPGEVEAHPFDFGVPEMVFDSVSEPPPAPTEEFEEGEELDESDLELQEEELEVETEEIDLAEAEEVKPAAKPRVPIADVGPKPGERRRRRRRRKRKSEWWSQIFDDDYVALLPEYTKRDTRRELDFVEKSLGVKQNELVLDLACGGGRHSVGMARRNFRVVGVDISLSMLARAGELAQDAGQKINFIHGDMRDLGFEQTFDGVFCLGTSLGYFDEKTNAAVLHGVFRALKPGRRFLLEMVNRDYIITKQPNLIWFEGDGVVCMEETDFSYITSRLHVKRQIIVGNGERQRSHEFSLRLYSLHEIGQMLHLSGFSVIQVGGHPATPGAFFGADSPRMVIVAERRR